MGVVARVLEGSSGLQGLAKLDVGDSENYKAYP